MYVDNGAFSYNHHKGRTVSQQPKFINPNSTHKIIIKAGALYMSTTIAERSAISTSSISTTYSTPFSGCILNTNVLTITA